MVKKQLTLKTFLIPSKEISPWYHIPDLLLDGSLLKAERTDIHCDL